MPFPPAECWDVYLPLEIATLSDAKGDYTCSHRYNSPSTLPVWPPGDGSREPVSAIGHSLAAIVDHLISLFLPLLFGYFFL